MNSEKPDPLQQPVDRELLQVLARHSDWHESSIRKTWYDEKLHPDRNAWLRWAVRFFVGLGATFILAGIAFFFVYSWNDMSRVLRFGLLEGSCVACGIFCLLRKQQDYFFKIGLTVLSMLVGMLLIVYGAEYQEGTNSWKLYGYWALLILPFAVSARFAPLWFIVLALFNIMLLNYSLTFWYRQHGWNGLRAALLNAIAVIVWEIAAWKKIAPPRSRWVARVAAAAALMLASLRLCNGISSRQDDYFEIVLACWVVLLTGGTAYYILQRDLLLTGVCGFSVLPVGATLIVHFFPHNDYFYALFSAALFVIAATSLLIVFMLNRYKHWKNEALKTLAVDADRLA